MSLYPDSSLRRIVMLDKEKYFSYSAALAVEG